MPTATSGSDFNGNYTSLILGHANPAVVKAIQDAAVHGMSFPGPSEHEIRLAEILTKRIPTMEVIRFANSGTEATMHAIRGRACLHRRSKIAKFEGAYHGTHDWVLVSVSTEEGQGARASGPSRWRGRPACRRR
jgi:glutamate-1-semialdehyde 2,1-aminomutase